MALRLGQWSLWWQLGAPEPPFQFPKKEQKANWARRWMSWHLG